MSKLVTDISEHQGKIDFAKMKRGGVSGVIIRAGYRSAQYGVVKSDPNFFTNINGATKAGLPAGVYWWTTSVSITEAKAEAETCLDLVKGHTLSFPVWLDIEFYNSKREGRADHLKKSKRTECAVAFLEAVKKAGYQAGVYCNKDFWRDSLDNSKLQNYARWIASYSMYRPAVDCDMWQYTSSASGYRYGVGSSRLDLSHCYTDFVRGEKSKFANAQKEEKNMDTLRMDDRGQQVRVLQKLLGGLAVDGIFGKNTLTAVKTFQKKKRLDADGIVGSKTWEKLLA